MGNWVAVAGAVLLAGCASITRGTTEQVQFDSDPSGAEMRSVIVNPCPQCRSGPSSPEHPQPIPSAEDVPPSKPGPACVTPCAVQVPRNEELIATFSKSGYQPETIHIETKLAGQGAAAFAGNAIIGGAIGGLVDAGTGAALNHIPNPAKALLKPLPPAATPKPMPHSHRDGKTSHAERAN